MSIHHFVSVHCDSCGEWEAGDEHTTRQRRKLGWSGDGRVCPCVLLDLEGAERPIVREDDDAGGVW